MITNFLVIRKAVRRFIQKYQTIIQLIFRFVLTYFAYDQITKSLNYSELLTKNSLKLGFGIVGAIIPEIVTILLLGLVALYEVYSAAPILAAFVLILFIVLYCFAARFSGKFAYAIIAIPLLFKFNLQYLIPILLGLTAVPLAIFPATVGVIFYYIFKVIVSSVKYYEITDFTDSSLADKALLLYKHVIDGILENKNMIYTIGIFVAVIIIMWLVRRLQYSFAFEITIAVGTCVCLIGHFLIYLKLDVPIDGAAKGILLSALIVCVVQFFRLVLDYSGVQSVQFEDDDYYYYVKAVPKIDAEVPDKFIHGKEIQERKELKPERKDVKKEDVIKVEPAPKKAKAEASGEKITEKMKAFFVGIGTTISEMVKTAHDNFNKSNKESKEKQKHPKMEGSDWDDLENPDGDDSDEEKETKSPKKEKAVENADFDDEEIDELFGEEFDKEAEKQHQIDEEAKESDNE